jgi:hypothetical protein
VGQTVQFVPLTFENGHVFFRGTDRGLTGLLATWIMCSRCGIIRRSDGQNKPCRGRVSVALRKER